MNRDERPPRARVADGVASLPRPAWDALVADVDNPFVEHAFLALLETAGAVGGKTGWSPRIVVVEDDAGRLLGAVPAYRRTDSFGEFVFDHAIADASHRLRRPYYPKLTVAVPFTPATGPRLLRRDEDAERVDPVLHAALAQLQADEGASSTHVLFCTDAEAERLAGQGFRRRAGLQFHWRNDGYASFDDFLARLRSEDRKQIRRERRRVVESGLVVEVCAGSDVPPSWWPRVYALYAGIYDRKWGRPYLPPAFFDGIASTLGDRAVVAVARDPGRPTDDDVVAMTLSFERGRALYGRSWGSDVDVPGLHFELCYYALLERAIARGQTLVEAGAQGEHKLKRGYLPCLTHSVHRFDDERLDHAVARFFAEEQLALAAERAALAAHGPFRNGAAPTLPLVAGLPRG
ncbi:MAG: GNAT family N-acetyltransferase [Deltaproteobacteria bacterium]|nr:GNAT family N-acetyltransferase [Deltaproteobacteria bacterium]